MGKRVMLCSSCSACLAVEFHPDGVLIGEDENIVKLSREEWNILVEKVKSGELDRIS